MAALGRVERRALHSPILKVDCGSGSTTSTTAAACLGAKLSVFDYFSLGSSLAVRNFGQIGGTLSVLDFLHLGSSAAGPFARGVFAAVPQITYQWLWL